LTRQALSALNPRLNGAIIDVARPSDVANIAPACRPTLSSSDKNAELIERISPVVFARQRTTMPVHAIKRRAPAQQSDNRLAHFLSPGLTGVRARRVTASCEKAWLTAAP